MHPVWFRIGRIPIHWYGVMMATGFLVGYANWLMVARNERRDTNLYADLLFWIIVAGIAGARLAYVVGDLRYFLTNPLQIIRVDQGGLTYYGGVVAATLAILFFARRRSESVLNLLDLVVTAVPLAHAFGRIGCFLNGCCYGKVHAGFFSVAFPQHSLPWYDHVSTHRIAASASRSLPVYPTQLIEAG
ncbi:MAG: prolipoprotein diacylglyceryl transferase, partial [Kiritimatiellae bacterium]|nr:prolipoprotein diacylglyceryl transferase [Kiritimatiellia bacterium]